MLKTSDIRVHDVNKTQVSFYSRILCDFAINHSQKTALEIPKDAHNFFAVSLIARSKRLEPPDILKTTVHIPDKIFKAADQFATELEISRSELYTRALKNLIRHHQHDQITKALNLVYADLELDETELAFLDHVGR